MSANVVSVTYREDGLRTLAIACSCGEGHDVVWPAGVRALKGELPCGAKLNGVTVPAWAMDPRHRTGYAKRNFPHTVGEADSAEDNASGEYEHKWIE